MSQHNTSFDASKSHLSPDILQSWLAQPGDAMFNLQNVPGIGEKSTKVLCESCVPETIRITNAYGLIGIFLALTKEGQSMQEHCDKFQAFLAHHELHQHNHMITAAIASKVGQMFPSLYSRESMAASGGKAAASPAVGASPVVPGA